MKPCTKLYHYHTIIAKIVPYPFKILCYSSDLDIPSLDELILVMKIIRVKSFPSCHDTLLITQTFSNHSRHVVSRS
jgi:hypothetical protein